MTASPDPTTASLLDGPGFEKLLAHLAGQGYQLVGPRLSQGGLEYGRIQGAGDLARGWTAEQAPGRYRLRRRDDGAVFAHTGGQGSLKSFLYPPRSRLWRAERTADGLAVTGQAETPVRYALIGVRPCDLQAVAVLDRVFQSRHVDCAYRTRREHAFMVAANCIHPAATCFCASMGTGPRATEGYDLVLTELTASGAPTSSEGEGPAAARHPDRSPCWLVEAGTPRGREALDAVPTTPATPHDRERADQLLANAARSMGRTLETEGIRDLLMRNLEHPRWDEVARRCLTCGNCTMVCPTCFCSEVEDRSDLAGEWFERWRRWEVCYSLDFTVMHGRPVRASARSRYRQWLTHKLGTWHDQFGRSGCVGCGRCITWCPVGIDITEEAAAIRQTDGAGRRARSSRGAHGHQDD